MKGVAVAHGLTTYRVDLGEVGSALGSANRALCAKVEKTFATRVADLDQALAVDPEGTSVGAALAELIDRGADALGYGPAHAYALELLVDHYGTFLANDAWYPCDVETIEGIDGLLRSNAAPLKLIELFFSGTPWSTLHEIEFLPAVGHLQARAVDALAATLKGKTVVGVDARVAAALGQVRDWLAAAREARQGLMFFYY